jgi:hypothetical protein
VRIPARRFATVEGLTMNFKRRKLLIDRDVQLGLVLRLVLHWITFLAATACVLPIARAILLADIDTPPWERMQQVGTDAGILLVVFLLLLPYFMYDTIKVTNRFAGPMYRLKMTIRALANGAAFHGMHFRSGDYWQDVAGDFNSMMARLAKDNARDTPEEKAAREQELASV